ncbi:MAG: Ig-like domain-containing protein, partial [Gammaproteobacteria bacterium]
DAEGNVASATLAPVDRVPPLAVDDGGEFAGTAVDVTVISNDGAGEALQADSVVFVNAPTGATLSADAKTLSIPGEGEWTVVGNGTVTFTPVAGFTDAPTPVQYTVDDAAGNTSSPATISLEDAAGPPTADDTGQFTGVPVTLEVLANESGAEGLDPATVQIVGTSHEGERLHVPGEGTWTVDRATSALTFTPEAGFNGQPSPISYTVRDTARNVSPVTTVTLSDAAPPAVNGDTVRALRGPFRIAVFAHDRDDSGLDPASITLEGAAGPGAPVVVPGEGTWTVDTATGVIVFTAEAGFEGSPAAVRYTVADRFGNRSAPATLTLEVGGLGAAPEELMRAHLPPGRPPLAEPVETGESFVESLLALQPPIIDTVVTASPTGDIGSVNVPLAVIRVLNRADPMGSNLTLSAPTAIINEVERIEGLKPFTQTAKLPGATDSWKFGSGALSDTVEGDEDPSVYQVFGEEAAWLQGEREGAPAPAGRLGFAEQLAQASQRFATEANALAAALLERR